MIYGDRRGISSFRSAVQDELGQVWTSSGASYYRYNRASPARNAVYPIEVGASGMVIDPTGRTIFLFADDPRTNGVFAIDPETGNRTRLAWNLDLIPLGALPVAMTYAAR